VTGTHDHRYERLRRLAEEELRNRPTLPAWQRHVMERFAVERQHGWYTLLNRFAPDTPADRPDAVLVGPLGVFVVLLRAEEPSEQASRAAFLWAAELLAGAETPRGLVTEAALRTVAVRPAGKRRRSGPSDEHLLLGETEMHRLFRCQDTDSTDHILTHSDCLAIARHLDDRTPDLRPIAWNFVPPQRTPGQSGDTGRPKGFFGIDQLREQEPGSEEPSGNRRIFLDEAQLGLVRRNRAGPARIIGPAGTGKSVVALHRLAYLARRTAGPLLFASPISTLPRLAENQFRTIAPQLAHRVRFVHLHAWAREFLTERGCPVEVDDREIDAAFHEVWERAGRHGPLGQVRPLHYWRDEIDRVIKGRGIGTLRCYQTVQRKGRGANLTTGFRSEVWKFYCEYERELSIRNVYDYNDIIMRALGELSRNPLPQQYSAVVVDEAQDLTLIGLRLVHAISGSEPNQLLLVEDGEQQVFTGGWRVSEAGIPLQGCDEALERNYRSRMAIAEYAAGVDAVNRFDDLDDHPTVALRSAQVALGGGRVDRWQGVEQETALIEALRKAEGPGNAVITRTHTAADRWKRVLSVAGFDVLPMERWDGHPSTAIVVGTVHLAKGGEFRAVFLPDEGSGTGNHREEQETTQRQRLVAATRARDYLWVGELERDSPSLPAGGSHC
jgi:hypothetical protein